MQYKISVGLGIRGKQLLIRMQQNHHQKQGETPSI